MATEIVVTVQKPELTTDDVSALREMPLHVKQAFVRLIDRRLATYRSSCMTVEKDQRYYQGGVAGLGWLKADLEEACQEPKEPPKPEPHEHHGY